MYGEDIYHLSVDNGRIRDIGNSQDFLTAAYTNSIYTKEDNVDTMTGHMKAGKVPGYFNIEVSIL